MPLELVFIVEKWGIDFIVPINHPSSTGHIFILMITDYFSKWEEEVSLKNVKDEQVISFLENTIFLPLGFHFALSWIMVPLSFLPNLLNSAPT